MHCHIWPLEILGFKLDFVTWGSFDKVALDRVALDEVVFCQVTLDKVPLDRLALLD